MGSRCLNQGGQRCDVSCAIDQLSKLLILGAVDDTENPSRVPAAANEFDRSASVRRVANVSHEVAAGSQSQPKKRPTKNRMSSSIRTSGGVHGQSVPVRKKSW